MHPGWSGPLRRILVGLRTLSSHTCPRSVPITRQLYRWIILDLPRCFRYARVFFGYVSVILDLTTCSAYAQEIFQFGPRVIEEKWSCRLLGPSWFHVNVRALTFWYRLLSAQECVLRRGHTGKLLGHVVEALFNGPGLIEGAKQSCMLS